MKRFGGVALALALLLAAGTVYADAKAEREARALFKEANRLLADKDYVGALDMFRAAYSRWPNPKILLNIGTTLRNLGRDAEAADAYEKYLREGKPDAKRRAEVDAILKELTARLATLQIHVNEPGARVLVDGKLVGESPQAITRRVEAGTHTIVAEKQGYPAAAATVQISAGQERVIELRLVQPNVTLPPGPAPTPLKPPGPPPKAAPDATPEGPAPTPPPPKVAQVTPEPAGGPAGGTVVAPAPPPLKESGRFGAFARADADGKFRGAAASVGATYSVLSWLEVSLAATLGPTFGFEPAATGFILKGTWRPLVLVGVPVLFSSGARPGVHAAAGVEWNFVRNFAAFLHVGVEVFPTAQSTATVKYEKVIFVPSLGLQARL